MRKTFKRQLDGLRAELGRMCAMAGGAVQDATTAVLEVDPEAAHDALATVEVIRALAADAEHAAMAILALQAPVASDLREVFSGIRISSGAGRMGGLAAHIAELGLRRHPLVVVPGDLRQTFAAMGRLATEMAGHCEAAVLSKDDERARLVCGGDATMEELHRSVFAAVQSPGWAYGTATAIDVTLLGRFYGRFGDQARDIADRVTFEAGNGHDASAFARV